MLFYIHIHVRFIYSCVFNIHMHVNFFIFTLFYIHVFLYSYFFIFIFMLIFYIYAFLYSYSCYIHVFFIFIFMVYFHIHVLTFTFMLYLYIHIHVVFHIHDLILLFMIAYSHSRFAYSYSRFCLFVFMVLKNVPDLPKKKSFMIAYSYSWLLIHIHSFENVPDLQKNHSTFFWKRQLILVCEIQDLTSLIAYSLHYSLQARLSNLLGKGCALGYLVQVSAAAGCAAWQCCRVSTELTSLE